MSKKSAGAKKTKMGSPFHIFTLLEEAPGKLEKASLLTNLSKTQQDLFSAALDPARVYYVTSEKLPKKSMKGPIEDESAAEFLLNLLTGLSKREYTGNVALEMSASVISTFSPLAKKWALRILDKNLRVGVDTAFLKAYPDAYADFNVQLCEPWEGENVEGWIVQPKLDGMRCMAVPINGTYVLLTRTGKPVYGVDKIIEQLKELPTHYWDGEVFSKNFDETIHEARTEGNTETDLTFNMFDAISVHEWKSKKTATYEDRLLRLKVAGTHKLQNVTIIPSDYVQTNPKWWIEHFMAQGFEGAVFKDPKSKYEWKRRKTWLKGKLMQTLDVVVTGLEEGTGRLAGTMGALLIDYNDIGSKVGTGFSDADREKFWNKHKAGTLLNKHIEVNAQEITKDGRLRFPAYVRERPDKDM